MSSFAIAQTTPARPTLFARVLRFFALIGAAYVEARQLQRRTSTILAD